MEVHYIRQKKSWALLEDALFVEFSSTIYWAYNWIHSSHMTVSKSTTETFWSSVFGIYNLVDAKRYISIDELKHISNPEICGFQFREKSMMFQIELKITWVVIPHSWISPVRTLQMLLLLIIQVLLGNILIIYLLGIWKTTKYHRPRRFTEYLYPSI